MRFVINVEPRTKKNSQQIFVNKKTGKPFISTSQAYKEYEKEAIWFIPKCRQINKPCNVKALFYMKTRRRVDLVNLQEALLDILVHAGLLEDDNSNIVVSMDGSRVLYDKNNPRTEVEIIEL